MFAVERIKKIKELVYEYKHVDVNKLSSILSVSEATIRRDLEKLETEGFLTRNYGGAVLNEESETEKQLEEEHFEHIEEKTAIGKMAANLIEDGETIFLGPGSTCLKMAQFIKKRDLTIVTNNMLVAQQLCDDKDIKLILTGGDVHYYNNVSSLVGQFAIKMLEDVFIDKVFISVDGIDIHFGCTMNSPEIAQVIKKVMAVSQQSILLSDYTKFDKKSFVRLTAIDCFHKVVTNQQIPDKFKAYFYDHNISLYTNYEINL